MLLMLAVDIRAHGEGGTLCPDFGVLLAAIAGDVAEMSSRAAIRIMFRTWKDENVMSKAMAI